MGRRVLCFDFGASGGRAMLAEYEDEKIKLSEVHRFKNRGVRVNGTLYWDILSIYNEIKTGLVKAVGAGGFESIGIDTWGVDYGIIDERGQLMGNPVQYRDRRTYGMAEKLNNIFDIEKLYELTGIQIMEINTIFQLMADKIDRPYQIEYGSAMLNIPDLLAYMLTGEISSEMSIASTTQLFNPNKLEWIDETEKLGLPKKFFHKIVRAGESKGFLSDEICSELNIPKAEVIAVCGHDTQCASFSVPAKEKDFIFLSSGTWSLLGTVLDKPIINRKAYDLGLSNEVGYGGSINLLKNITGLWLIQETKAFLESRGESFSYAKLEELARNSVYSGGFIDPDAPEFAVSGDIPSRVVKFCRENCDNFPESPGEVLKTIYISLAMKYRFALEQISDLTDKKYNKIYMVGGGTKDNYLCQTTADVCGILVVAGPAEATVTGNAAMQLLHCGAVEKAEDIPEIIARSEKTTVYLPKENYDEEYKKFLKLLKESV